LFSLIFSFFVVVVELRAEDEMEDEGRGQQQNEQHDEGSAAPVASREVDMRLDEDRKRKRAERFGLPASSEESSSIAPVASALDDQPHDLTSRCVFPPPLSSNP
jgi:hypothetical protein